MLRAEGSKHIITTLIQEAKDLLGAAAPDADALTRGQQKKIEDIQAEKPSPKKPKLSKNTTMAATAKVCLHSMARCIGLFSNT